MRTKCNGLKITQILSTSNERSNILQYLLDRGIDFISEVYTSSDLYGKDKMIETFCEKHSLSKEDVIYIGDEVRDIRACHKSGVAVIWVNWGYDTAEQAVPEQPSYMAKEPAELLALVE